MRIIMLFTLLLFSCKAVKEVETKNHTYKLKGKEVKSFNKSEKAYKINAQGSRVFSLYQFPTKDSVNVKIEYKEGKTDTIIEIVTEYDTINNVDIKYIYKYIHRVDTLVKDSVITQIDIREIEALTSENSKIKTERDVAVKRSQNRLIIIMILSILLAISIFFHLRR